MSFADGLAVNHTRGARRIVGLVLAVVLAATGLTVASASAQPVRANQSAAARCSAHHLFGAEPVDVAKTADGQTVLAQVSWQWHDSIGCYLVLDDDATAALRAAGPPASLPRGQTEASRRCSAHHLFGAEPVDVAKTADNRTVLARLSWGLNTTIGCYLVLDPAAVSTLRAAATPPTPPATAPGTPTGVTATPGIGQIAVAWTAPADDGGAAITYYTVAYKDNALICPATTDATWTLRTTTRTSITLSSLTDGSAYRLCVKATNSQGDSNWATATATPASVPGAPTNITTTAGNSQISITWSAPPANGARITSYTIQRCAAANRACTSTWTDAGTATTTRHTIASLANGTSHGIRIRATNANGSGPWSSTAFGNTITIPPEAPSELTAEVSSRTINLAWVAPSTGGSPITSYTVQCRVAANAVTTGTCNNRAWAYFSTTANTSVSVSNLTNGVSYDLRVRATNRVGSSPWSSVTATASTTPGIPSNFQVSTAGRDIQASWRAPSSGGTPITSYTVDYCIGGCTSWSSRTISGDPPATSTTLTGLRSGSTYTVRVRGTNAAGDGPWTNSRSASTPTRPSAPTSLNISSWGNDSLTANWTAPAGSGASAITGYTLQYCTASAGSGGLWYCTGGSRNISNLTSTSHTITGLNGSTAYRVRVQAVNPAGSSGWSNAATITTDAPTAPSDPSNVTLTASSGRITVRWTASDPNGARISRYTVQCANTGSATTGSCKDSSYTQYATTTSTSTTISGLKNGNQYSVQVRATNSAGNSSWVGDSATPAGNPGTPPNLTLTESYDQSNGYTLNADWDDAANNGSDITNYTMEYRVGSGNWSLAYVGSNTDYRLTNLTVGTTYYVKVRATNAIGNSSWAQKSARVSGTPDAPESLSVSGGAGQVDVSWSAPGTGAPGITGYNIQRCTVSYNQTADTYTCTSGWSQAGTTTSTSTSFTITGLNAETRYGVRVQAVNAAGGGRWTATDRSSGGWSVETDAATAPSDPSNLTATAGNGRVTLRWTASNSNGARISGYTVECLDNDSENTSGSCKSDDWSRYTTTTSTSTTISSLKNGIQYSFRVKATNKVGDSGWAEASATPATTPGKPTGLTLTEGHDGGNNFRLNITWTASESKGSTINGYAVEYRASGAFWTFTTFASGTDHTLTNLSSGTTYDVRVRAESDIGNSGWTQASVRITGRPGKPTGVSLSSGDNSITVNSWSDPSYTGGSEITSYNIQRCTVSHNKNNTPDNSDDDTYSCSGWSSAGTTDNSSPSLDITGLPCGKRFGVRVQAVNSYGSGPWSDTDRTNASWSTPTNDCPDN